MLCFFRPFLQSRKFSSGKDPVVIAKQWIEVLAPVGFPRSAFRVTYSRSSGPGGQKVNKTSSKATVTLNNWRTAKWLPDEVRKQLGERGFRYATKSGDWVVQNDTVRSREQNTELCFQKLCDEIKKTVKFPGEVSEEDQQKWRDVRRKTNEQRLREKEMRSWKKQSRKKDWD